MNDYLCEVALRRWDIVWCNYNGERICLSCKPDLVSGRPHSTYSKKSGRPQTKQPIGFIYVCSKCHTEVRRTNKKHRCSLANTKIFLKRF